MFSRYCKEGGWSMARPTKSVKALSDYSQTKAEIAERAKNEEKLKAKGELTPPRWLNKRQKAIFKEIVAWLKESEMLAVNDTYILLKTAIAIERIEQIEKDINERGLIDIDATVLSLLRQYTSDFYRGCNELCLSPQSRAKLANAAMAKERAKPLEDIIKRANL